MNSASIRLKRIYDPAEPDDGRRILVDRLWPRGLKKADAAVDVWAKELAPSDELRRWFGHDPARWEDVRRRYREALMRHPDRLSDLVATARAGPVTLLFAARDATRNNAVVLKDVLEAMA